MTLARPPRLRRACLLLALLASTSSSSSPSSPLACPRSLLSLRFDNGTCASPAPAERPLLACPQHSRFTCCASHHDRQLRAAHGACLLSGASAECCAALNALACTACDGAAALEAAAARPVRVCAAGCARALQRCAGAQFAADERGSGRLSVCAPDSLVCSRLGDVVEAELALAGAAAALGAGAGVGDGDNAAAPRRQVEAAVCARMGFEVAANGPAAGDGEAGAGADEGERAEASCFRGSVAARAPEGALLLDNSTCKPRERVVVEARGLQGDGAEGAAGAAGVGDLVRRLALASAGPLARAAIAASVLVAVLVAALVAWMLCARKDENAGAAGHVLGAGPLPDEFASQLEGAGVGAGAGGVALGALSDEARRQLMLEARRRRFEPPLAVNSAPALAPAPASPADSDSPPQST
jgi:hypothetical protein